MHKHLLPAMAMSTLLLALTACGFHLRRGAPLPPSMQRIHLVVRSSGNLQRELARALEASGANLVKASGPGVAEFQVPVARFRTRALTFTGQARVGEYAVSYVLDFQVRDSNGKFIIRPQQIRLSREFTYDARQPVGTATQTEQLQQSLVNDAVQAVLFRLRAAAEHIKASTPAAATSAAAAGHPSSTD